MVHLVVKMKLSKKKKKKKDRGSNYYWPIAGIISSSNIYTQLLEVNRDY